MTKKGAILSEKTKERARERARQYYADNREKVLQKLKEYPSQSPERCVERMAAWVKANPDRHRNSYYKRTYGITLEEYNQMFDKQAGCCAICGKHQSELKKPLFVDHNHKTNQVRGLLCHHCNSALGLLNEDQNTILNTLEYLRSYE